MRLVLTFLLLVQLGIAQKYVVTNVNVVPVNTNTVLTNMNVFVTNGVIEKIIPADAKPELKGYKAVDGKGKYLIPGLADMHAHFPDDKSAVPLQQYLKLNLAAGVTTIRSMRGDESQLKLRDSINKKQKIGPGIYVSYVFPDADSILTKEKIEELVLTAKNKNFDFIKYLGGLQKDNMAALSQSCDKNKISIAGHAFNKNLEQSVALGFISVEHFQPILSSFYKDSMNFYKTINFLKAKNAALCPTLSFYYVNAFLFSETELLARNGMQMVSQKVKDQWLKEYNETMASAKEQLKADFETKFVGVYKKRFADFNRVLKFLADNEVLLLLSPDDGNFNVPGFGMVEEMKLYRQAGLSNYQILKIATLNAAIYFKTEKNTGSVEVGKKADLVLLNADPLLSIENCRHVEGTFLNGKYYSQKELLGRVK